MRYQTYQARVMKTADFLRGVLAHGKLILITLAGVLVTLAVLTAVSGTVYGETDIPGTLYYGDAVSYTAHGFLARVSCEYGIAGEDGTASAWSGEVPVLPGRYAVRTVSRGMFGITRRGDARAFEILPRPVALCAEGEGLVWGEAPALSVEGLADGDRVTVCALMRTSSDGQTASYAPAEPVRIENALGEDVTAAYAVTRLPKTLTFLPRDITVSVPDASFVYDGTRVTFEEYTLSDGSLAGDERLTAVFEAGLTRPGTTENTPVLRVTDADGADVTGHYRIKVQPGTLTVTKRPLSVTTESADIYFDRQPHTFDGFEIADDTPLVPGHAVTGEWVTVTDVGAVNIPTLSVLDAAGEDVTDCYDVTLTPGMLNVSLRPLYITTESAEITYDGQPHTFNRFTVEEGSVFLPGHTVKGEWLTLLDAGSAENRPALRVTDAKHVDVTAFYTISLTPGTVRILPRPLTLEFPDEEIEYDGNWHSLSRYIVKKEDGLVPGDRLTNFGLPVYKYPGSYPYRDSLPDIRIVNADGKIVTDNYAIECVLGTLTIRKHRLVIHTDSAVFEYDGQPHTKESFTCEKGTSLLSWRNIHIQYGSITDVGTVDNLADTKVTVMRVSGDSGLEAEDETAYHDITVIPGRLSVRPRGVLYHSASHTWIYDGTEKSDSGLTRISEEDLIPGHTLAVKSSRSVRDVGKFDNTVETAVLDAGGADVTKNYSIGILPGILQILPRPVTLTPDGQTRVYDGRSEHPELLCAPDSPYPLAEGDTVTTISWQMSDEEMRDYEDVFRQMKAVGADPAFATEYLLSRVGSMEWNPVEAEIVGADGRNVTANYIITFRPGIVTITPRPVILTSASAVRTYDGTPLTDSRITTAPDSPYPLAAIDTVSANVTGSRTEVGSSPNAYKPASVRMMSEYGMDVTDNYEILECRTGTLTVTAVGLTVSSASDSKRYDGTPLRNSGWDYTVTEGTLPEDWHLDVTVSGRRSNIGVSENTLTCRVLDGKNRDVTAKCNITLKPGTLEVKPRVSIVVTTDSDTKLYDGKPLTAPGYQAALLAGNMPAGYGLSVNVTGSRTAVGTSENTAEVRVVDMFLGRDVTSQFEIIVKPGTLTVLNPVEHIDNDDTLFGYVTASASGRLYLRLQAYGDYTGRGWKAAPPYTGTLPGGYSYDTLTALALQQDGRTQQAVAHFRGMKTFVLRPYFALPGASAPFTDSDTGYPKPIPEYTFAYYPLDMNTDWSSLAGVPAQYAAYEAAYRRFVGQVYLTVDDETRTFLENNYIRPYGLSASDPDVIEKVAALIKASAAYNVNYNPALDAESNAVIAFLSDYREGVCRHYAASATLLFRALGIPARYVEGFSVMCTAGVEKEIRNPGHAWTEVYLDGIGWIPVEVTGGANPAPVTVVTVKPRYVYKEYDGTPLYADGTLDRKGALAELLDAGYTYTVKVGGSQTEVGTGVSTVEEFRLFDPTGKDVTGSGKFLLKYETGVLQVTSPQVRIFLYQLSKYYDGTPLTYTDDDLTVLSCPDGLTVKLSVRISLTEPGQLSLSDINACLSDYITVRLYKNGTDVTDSYTTVVTVPDYMDEASYIPIEVKKRPIELQAASVTRLDDGTPLSDPTVSVTKGTLVRGDTLAAQAVGTLSSPGSIPNVLSPARVRIVNAKGEDVTHCYDVSCVNGVLTILPGQ